MVEAVVIAFERQGVTVFVEAVNDRVLGAVLPETPEELLAGWGRHRAAVLELANAVVSLGAGTPSLEGVSETAAAAFRQGRAVMEEVEARRALRLAGAHDVVLTFETGTVVAASGPGGETVLPWLAAHGGHSGRISHLGVGLNPDCPGGTGWTVLDEHRAGAVFLALGENRYMGGTNTSTLNHDVVLDEATLLAGDVALVLNGHLAVKAV